MRVSRWLWRAAGLDNLVHGTKEGRAGACDLVPPLGALDDNRLELLGRPAHFVVAEQSGTPRQVVRELPQLTGERALHHAHGTCIEHIAKFDTLVSKFFKKPALDLPELGLPNQGCSGRGPLLRRSGLHPAAQGRCEGVRVQRLLDIRPPSRVLPSLPARGGNDADRTGRISVATSVWRAASGGVDSSRKAARGAGRGCN